MVLGDNPVAVPLWSQQISQALTWNRTQTSLRKGRRLTARAIVQRGHSMLNTVLDLLNHDLLTELA